MSIMKYENGILQLSKQSLQDNNIDISKMSLKLFNKTNRENRDATLNNNDGKYIHIHTSYFCGDGYYVAILSETDTNRIIEQYGFYHGNEIIVNVYEKVRKDSHGTERCYLKLDAKGNVPENILYFIADNLSWTRMNFGVLKENVPVYYTFRKPDNGYVLEVEKLVLDNDVIIKDKPRYGIMIHKPV